MTTRLLRGGHEVVVYDINVDSINLATKGGATGASALDELVSQLPAPRAVWIMVPAGPITEETVSSLQGLLQSGDTIVDGGNSKHTDSIRRAEQLAGSGINLLDAGTSGGVWGLKEGYCLMVGGDRDAFARLEPIFETLAPPGGYLYTGRSGSGHFTKMIHNGIEYALMESYGEGFELLAESSYDLDVPAIAELWRHGSVVRSWLLDLAADALGKDPKLDEVSDYVEDSGEGRWTIEHAIDNAVPAPAIALALFRRFESRQQASFSGKLLSALRKEFGGHEIRAEKRKAESPEVTKEP